MITSYSRDLVVEREETRVVLNRIEDNIILPKTEPGSNILHITGFSLSGKTWLLKTIESQLSDREDVLPIYLQLRMFLSLKPQSAIIQILREVARRVSIMQEPEPTMLNDPSLSEWEISSWLLSTTFLEKSSLIFLFDDVDVFPGEHLRELELRLLAFIPWAKSTMVLFAGRYPQSRWINSALRPRQDNILNLNAFNLERTRLQLQRQLPGTEHLAEEIYEISRGVPGYTYLLASQASGEPKRIPDKLAAVRECNQRMLSDVPPEIYFYLKALSVLAYFYDEEEMAPILESATGETWGAARCVGLHKKFSNIHVGPGLLMSWNREKSGYVFEEQIRHMVELELRFSEPELWRRLHCIAYQMNQDLPDQPEYKRWHDLADYHANKLREAGYTLEDCR